MGNTCLYNTLQGMVAPTTEQICCIVGNTPLHRHFQPKLPPTVNCRNVHELPGLPSYSKGPSSRQDNGTPNPLQTHLQDTFHVPLPKKCYGWHTKPPLGGLRGTSGVPSSWKGRGKVGKHKKRWPKDHLLYLYPDRNYRDEYSLRIKLFAQCSSNIHSNSYSCTYHWVVTDS